MHTVYVCSHDVCMHAHNTDKHSCTLYLYTFIHVPTYTHELYKYTFIHVPTYSHAQCICIQPLYMYISTHKLIQPTYTQRCAGIEPPYMCTSTHKLMYMHPHQVHCIFASSYMYIHALCIRIQPLHMYTSTHKLTLLTYTHAQCRYIQPLCMCTSTYKLIDMHPHQVHCTCVSSYMYMHALCICMQSLYMYKSTHKLILPIYTCTMYIYTATAGWQRLIGCF